MATGNLKMWRVLSIELQTVREPRSNPSANGR
jgi:hypothetical protein